MQQRSTSGTERTDTGNHHLRPRDLLRRQDAIHWPVDDVEPQPRQQHQDIGLHEVTEVWILAECSEGGWRREHDGCGGHGMHREEGARPLEDDRQLVKLLRAERLQPWRPLQSRRSTRRCHTAEVDEERARGTPAPRACRWRRRGP